MVERFRGAHLSESAPDLCLYLLTELLSGITARLRRRIAVGVGRLRSSDEPGAVGVLRRVSPQAGQLVCTADEHSVDPFLVPFEREAPCEKIAGPTLVARSHS
jgi:hypothetical protein